MKRDDDIAATDKLLQVIRGNRNNLKDSEEVERKEAQTPPSSSNSPDTERRDFILSKRLRPKIFNPASRVKIGLDIGTHTIKMIQLERTARGHRLLSFGVAELEPEKGTPEGILYAKVRAINELLAGVNLRKTLIITSINDPSMIIRQVSMPKMPLKDVERAISFESRRHIPHDPSGVKLSYQVLKGKKESSMIEVLLVAIPLQAVDSHMAILSRSGISPYIVDVGPLALINAYFENREVKHGETVVLLDLGARTTSLNVYREDAPFFSRIIPISGNHFSRELEKKMKIKFLEAERLKRDPRLIPKALKSDGPTKRILLNALAPILNRLLLEIRRSLTFYDNNNGKQGFSRVVISGGSTRIEGIKDFLEEELVLPLEIFNPFDRIEINEGIFPANVANEYSSQLALAVGLASRN